MRNYVVKSFVIKSTFPTYIERGWGNGYVAVDSNHPLYGKHYDDLRCEVAHGGLTYSGPSESINRTPEFEGLWVFGFDTAHYGDNKENCHEGRVRELTEELRKWFEARRYPWWN